jgi:hypothetical protein
VKCELGLIHGVDGVRVREFRLRIIIGAMADFLQRERRPCGQ